MSASGYGRGPARRVMQAVFSTCGITAGSCGRPRRTVRASELRARGAGRTAPRALRGSLRLGDGVLQHYGRNRRRAGGLRTAENGAPDSRAVPRSDRSRPAIAWASCNSSPHSRPQAVGNRPCCVEGVIAGAGVSLGWTRLLGVYLCSDPEDFGFRRRPARPRVGLCDGVTARVKPRSLCDRRCSRRDESFADFGRPGDVVHLVTPRCAIVAHVKARQAGPANLGQPRWHESSLPSRQPGRGHEGGRCAQGLWINCGKYVRMAMTCQGTRLEKQGRPPPVTSPDADDSMGWEKVRKEVLPQAGGQIVIHT